MAAPMKKRAVDNEMKDLENDQVSEEDDLVDNDNPEEIQVDFEARNPEDSDFHGIRKLLQQLFLKANIKISEIADTIISQNYVGSILMQAYIPEDDDSSDDDELEVFGVVTVLNVTERQKLDSVKELKSYLQEKCEKCSKSEKDKFSKLLHDSDNQVGFILNERFINIPPQIALPSFESLWKEVERANKKKMKYNFTDYIMMCKTLKMPGIGKNQGQRVFVNPEEEYFFEEAKFSFEYSVKEERDNAVGGMWGADDDDLEPFRTVIVISAEKLPSIMGQLKENLSMP